ncbi:hypothetical protein [Acidovorax sp. BL-A-41-H1]|uniref:hypothetical protein n=1 Tax=Acidovorax sp. BL-A-41-H1 TaxID=3421102 RepID=UPI003F7A0E37
MSVNALVHACTPSSIETPPPHRAERRGMVAGGQPHCPTGVGGTTVAGLLELHCAPALRAPHLAHAPAVVVERLDAQAGTWQMSLDEGRSWRPVRTDLVNRPGNMGLALDRTARLRVLPFSGHRVPGVRLSLHAVQRSHGAESGSYRAYSCEERDEHEEGSATIALVLTMGAINGTPPAVHVPRPRNKRALVKHAALAAAAATSAAAGQGGAGTAQGAAA